MFCKRGPRPRHGPGVFKNAYCCCTVRGPPWSSNFRQVSRSACVSHVGSCCWKVLAGAAHMLLPLLWIILTMLNIGGLSPGHSCVAKIYNHTHHLSEWDHVLLVSRRVIWKCSQCCPTHQWLWHVRQALHIAAGIDLDWGELSQITV